MTIGDNWELGIFIASHKLVLPEPLRVRIRYDFDTAGQPGSMQVFLKLGEEDEINPVTDAQIPEGSALDGYRILQQMTNGKTNWKVGDVVAVDDFTLSNGQ